MWKTRAGNNGLEDGIRRRGRGEEGRGGGDNNSFSAEEAEERRGPGKLASINFPATSRRRNDDDDDDDNTGDAPREERHDDA